MTAVRGDTGDWRRNSWLACGIGGVELNATERAELEALQPGGIVLFARNVQDRERLSDLTSSLRELSWQPYIAIDMEGGRVNRLAGLTGPLPAPARASENGPEALRALGEALGCACAYFGISVDYAPVVDVGRGGYVGGEGRCLGSTPDAVVAAAGHILAGIESFGVAACLKHYPGLGSGQVDSHRELPELDDWAAADEEVFRQLVTPARAIMVAHAMAPSLGEACCPASLSRVLVKRLDGVPVGPIIADDLEMGALGRFGPLPARAAAAMQAGCHQVLICNALSARREVVEAVLTWSESDVLLSAAVRAAGSRLAAYGQAPVRAVGWDEVEARAARARELAGIGS
ncbi:MAG TPA: glycoside hydrolase family 3 N-terminal domain-containing protein [Thermoanaerobaculaceae bacterium]|nr:glycoside hydrolase family 3 N-terminal domain-containing protein [Thermoanaerobaculaceae bacterium]HPS79149.1 glycoside hydrolase family 3 N-terminal domain-containing protein [Thermoanaerobaculaceae bacterium]